jgi:hypothetical protein
MKLGKKSRWGFLKKDIYKCPKSKSAEGVSAKALKS